MTTKYKIIAGFIVMILLQGGMAALGFFGLEKAGNGFIDYRRNARVNVTASDMEAHLYLSYANTVDAILDNNMKKLDEAQTLADDFGALAKVAASEAAAPERIAVFDSMQGKAQQFKAEQGRIRVGVQALHQQYDTQVMTNGNLLIEKLTSLAEVANSTDNTRLLYAISLVWNDLAACYSSLGRFVESGNSTEGAAAAESIASMGKGIERMGALLITDEGRQIFREMTAAHKAITEASNVMVQNAAAMRTALEDMRNIETSTAEALTAVNQDVDAGMRALGTQVLEDNAQSQQFMMMLSAVGLILGLLLAAFIIVGIVRVLNQLSQFAAAVARGDFSYQMKSREKGEIGVVIGAMRQIPEVLTGMVNIARALANDINVGKLRQRGETAALQGAYADLGNAINGLSDAYTEIIDALPMPVFTCDKSDAVLFLNASGQKVVGQTGASLTAKDILNTGDDRQFGQAAMAKNSATAEEAVITLNGNRMDVAVSSLPLSDMNHQIAGYLEIMTDLTEIRAQQRTMLDVAHRASEISNRVAAASEELSAQVEQVSRGAEMQRERMESTASAMTEMNATVLEVARSAGQASEQSEGTRLKAEEGATLVQQVIGSINAVNAVGQRLRVNMEELGRQAESIGSVMNVISDIADQTNLLALNAAIEAARAGEAGRGFAVVADEVRKLAEKTMTATQEVGSNIKAVQNSARINIEEVGQVVASVEEANGLADSSGGALSEIVNLASANSSVVASIATAAEEQSATSDEINRAIEEVTRVVAETAEGMVQSSAAVQDLSQMAQELRLVMEGLQ
ncbi:methyl-accepting chemotaxis protein [Desulfovibrio sp. OttesenSCG-928-I05]|nr:methyl-accepting chemotaxis protein [Desulfovibrio sp. OttesenSCG-928-I05]